MRVATGGVSAAERGQARGRRTREKVIAARRAKVRHIIMPKDNEGDWEQLPDHLKQRVTPHFVATFDEVIALCMR